MVEAAILTCRWLGLRPTHPSQRYGFCLRRFFMVNLPHGREIQGSLGVRSLLLRSILRLVWLNGLSVVYTSCGLTQALGLSIMMLRVVLHRKSSCAASVAFPVSALPCRQRRLSVPARNAVVLAVAHGGAFKR